MIVQVTGTNSSNDAKESKINEEINTFYFSKLIRIVRILGLLSIISYITVILFTWIYANKEGFVYFSAGEPSPLIKYSEWILGFLAFFVSIYYLLMELSGYNCVRAAKS